MKAYQQQTMDAYNAQAKAFEATRAAYVPQEQLTRFLNAVSGKKILDLGCGVGQHTAYFASQGYEAIGVDVSEGLLAIARERVPALKFVQADMLALPFADASFDGIWANAVLHHLKQEDMPTAMKELFRVLTADGICYLSVKEGTGEGFVSEPRMNGVKRFFSYVQKETYIASLEAVGFEVIHYSRVVHDNGVEVRPWIQVLLKKVSL